MSIEALSWAWKHSIASSEKLTLLALADHSDPDGICWPGVRGLSRKTGLSEKTIRRSILAMESMGLLEKSERRRKDGYKSSNQIHLLLSNLSGHHDHQDNISAVTVSNLSGHHDQTSAVTMTRQESSIKPIIEPLIANRDKNRKKSDPLILPDWLPLKVWEDFKQHRKELRSPLSQYAEGLTIKRLGKLKSQGHDPTAVIEQSIEMGWKGLFEVRSNGNSRYNRNEEIQPQRMFPTEL